MSCNFEARQINQATHLCFFYSNRGWLWTNKSLEERVREIEVQKRDPSRIMQKERSRYLMDCVNSPVTLNSQGGWSQVVFLIEKSKENCNHWLQPPKPLLKNCILSRKGRASKQYSPFTENSSHPTHEDQNFT